ncbi:hypothetical protein ACIOG3_15880 [Yersinia rochesterensis]|uniref:hypothetical protein n=1 Tax=Yersinia rochesterensis TaxID=1604335 RepID=UPI00118556F9|nr:hypothetical protein [Yersinia rochesterensis]
MKRNHSFTHLQTVPHEAWSELCRAVTQVHHRIRNEPDFCWLGKPLIVYNHSGTKPLRYDDSMVGLGVISFNGDFGTGLSGDPLCLIRLFSSERQQSQCDTGHHPYDFMVMAVLLLVNHYCPTCYALHSTVERTEWQQISDWLNTHLHLAVMLPPGLQQTDAIIG